MTNLSSICTVQESGAFLRTLKLGPTGSGPLDGLCFGVKDLFDIGGYVTGCGNPDWARTHPQAVANAVCVDQLLSAGATCIGKTVCDELAFSLDGENVFYGTPLNPRAPERVPGGSSSGSAAAVACGLADFALGTDTGGSVRVPASNCGLFGLRPSHGRISVAGVNSLSPSFDTVGILAASADILTRVAAILLAFEVPGQIQTGTIHLIKEAFEIADPEARESLMGPVQSVTELLGGQFKETSPREIVGESRGEALQNWNDIFCTIQWAEIWSCLGAWVEEVKPAMGPRIKANFEGTRTLDRRRIGLALRFREAYCRDLAAFLGSADLLCMPTTPALAPRKGTLGTDARYQSGTAYYPRTLSLTAIAGIGRLPQVSLPLAEVAGVPLGLSLLAAHGQDAFLLAVAQKIAASI
jgi:amidase